MHLEDFFDYRWLLISNVLHCFERFLYDITFFLNKDFLLTECKTQKVSKPAHFLSFIKFLLWTSDNYIETAA